LLEADGDLTVGDNEPYAVSDLTDYSIPVHGEHRHLPHVEIEIRQDLIAEPAGQQAWAERLARVLPEAWRHLSPAPSSHQPHPIRDETCRPPRAIPRPATCRSRFPIRRCSSSTCRTSAPSARVRSSTG